MAEKKSLFIAEKPSVAEEFAKVVEKKLSRHDGYREGEHCIVTWCFGHLVTMSYPEAYDEKYRRWRLDTLPFLPEKYLYEVINSPSSKKQFSTVKKLLNRSDVDTIYVCTDSGREGEYIYRLVRQMSGVHGKNERRVWINSQTEDEIRRGIQEARPLSFYDSLSDAAYLRAKEDYLMGINFSRLLTLKYGDVMASFLQKKYCVVAVGRVMTCVLGMVTKREQEIRAFKKTPFYRVIAKAASLEFEWKAVEGSRYFASPLLYRDNGFTDEAEANKLIEALKDSGSPGIIQTVSKRQEKKNPPLLFNLAELQNECSKLFKISPDETLKIVQELYEKKLVTYPRTDARVLSSAVAKEIKKNISGLSKLPEYLAFAQEIIESEAYRKIQKSRYVNDSAITDHYAIIPTGAGLSVLSKLPRLHCNVYEVIARRFLAIFFKPAVYQKLSAALSIDGELFFTKEKRLKEAGYLSVMDYSFKKKKAEENSDKEGTIDGLRKGKQLPIEELFIRSGETSPPKRYTTGSIILAMENAGNLIEDEELREQIRGSGIGTSATRAEILDKLIRNDYLRKDNKTQILTPSMQGEMVYYVVGKSIASMLNPKLTAEWEKGLSMVNDGRLSEKEYMEKLKNYIERSTTKVLSLHNSYELSRCFGRIRELHDGERRPHAKRKLQNRKPA